MIRHSVLLVFLSLFLWTLTCPAAGNDAAPQSPLSQGTVQANKFPRIVLYSVAWCPHCREAKEYLTKNNIPFINKDVEIDSTAMDELTQKYKSSGVPVIVFGNDEKILKGFNRDQFEKVLKEMRK
jgi:glutaredoxin-like YruB-family protein